MFKLGFPGALGCHGKGMTLNTHTPLPPEKLSIIYFIPQVPLGILHG